MDRIIRKLLLLFSVYYKQTTRNWFNFKLRFIARKERYLARYREYRGIILPAPVSLKTQEDSIANYYVTLYPTAYGYSNRLKAYKFSVKTELINTLYESIVKHKDVDLESFLESMLGRMLYQNKEHIYIHWVSLQLTPHNKYMTEMSLLAVL